jgi:hypothetical protein
LLELLYCSLFVEPEFFLYPEVRALDPIVLDDVFYELFLVGVPEPPYLVLELPLYYYKVEF